MTTKLETRLEIKSWDEKPFRELTEGQKFTRADVALASEELEGTWFALMYYRADGTGTYGGLMHLTGSLGDRTGSLVLQSTGTYDGTTARVELSVVPGSGTDDLAGVSGSAISVSTHGDYPFWPMTIEYDIA